MLNYVGFLMVNEITGGFLAAFCCELLLFHKRRLFQNGMLFF